MIQKKYLYSILGITIVASILSVVAFSINSINLSVPAQSPGGLQYHATVCTYKTPWLEDHYGDAELIGCSHNQLYTFGQNLTRDALGQGLSPGAITNISLCNATANGACGTPNAAATENFTKYTNCGLDGGTGGTYAALSGYNGNWTVFKTFTSSCDNVLTNATRISNNSGTAFAGNTFSLVTLQTNDQLTVNWSISIS